MNQTRTRSTRRRKPRLKDIAAAADISVAAVSMALADHPRISVRTKEQVRRLSRQLGYPTAAAQHLRPNGSTDVLRIGLVAVGRDWERMAHAVVLRAFAGLAMANPRVRIEFASIEHTAADTVHHQVLDFARGVDALVMTNFVDRSLLRAVAEAEISCVIYGHLHGAGGQAESLPAHVIAANEQSMAEAATHRLFERGHQRIAFVCEVLPAGLSHARWLAGYQLAHLERGVVQDPDLAFITGEVEQGEDRAAAHFDTLDQPPTAFIIPDARIAASFLHEMSKRGRPIAHDAMVIHAVPQVAQAYRLDDCPMCFVDPDKVATLAVRLLLDLMDKPLAFGTETTIAFDVRNWQDAPLDSQR